MLTDRTSKPPLKMITNDYNDYKKRNEGKSKRWAFYKVVTASHRSCIIGIGRDLRGFVVTKIRNKLIPTQKEITDSSSDMIS